MSKKSIFSLVLALFLMFSIQAGTLAKKESDKESKKKEETTTEEKPKKKAEGEFPDLHTEYYLLADLSDGKVLKSNNVNEKVFPASTTKILTAIIALESCNPGDKVTATSEAISPITNKHSHMGILVGEELTVEQLVYGLLVGSANDAANVLAVHISGSLDVFAKLMNEKAAEIGAENSHFVNAHGFHDDNHYTTVNDLWKISHYAMQNQKFREIVATSKYEVPPTNKYRDKKNGNKRYLSNTNMLISGNKGTEHLYEYAIGVKTGHTDEAGYCLVSAAEKDGTELLSIVMKCDNGTKSADAYSFIDSKALLEYGFYNYKYITVGDISDIVESADIRNAKIDLTLSPAVPVSALLEKNVKKEDVEVIAKKNEDILAPIKKGDVLGTVTYKYKGEVLGTVNLVAGNDVERDFLRHIGVIIGDNFGLIILCAIIIFVVFVYFKYLRSPKKRRAKSRLRRIDDMQRRRRY